MRSHLGRQSLAAAVTSIIATILATIALLAGSADAVVVARPAIPHPTLAESVVLRVSTTNNYWGGTYDDGHTITTSPVPPITEPGPRSTEVLDGRSTD